MNESSSGEETPPQNNYLNALKKNLATKAVKSKVIIDLTSSKGNHMPKRPTNIEIENLIFETLKLDPNYLQGIHTFPGARAIIVIVLKKEIDISVSFAHVEDTFVVRDASVRDDGIRGAVRGLKAQRKDENGNPIVFEKKITVHSPHEDVKPEDVNTIFQSFGKINAPAKEMVFTEGKLKGIKNGNYCLSVVPEREIPGFLALKGHKTRISYNGQSITCAKCYESGHFARDCTNQYVRWADYCRTLQAKPAQEIIAENQSQKSSTVVSVTTIDCHEPSGPLANNDEDTSTSLEAIELSCGDNDKEDSVSEVEEGNNQNERSITNMNNTTNIENARSVEDSSVGSNANIDNVPKKVHNSHIDITKIIPRRTRSQSSSKRNKPDGSPGKEKAPLKQQKLLQ